MSPLSKLKLKSKTYYSPTKKIQLLLTYNRNLKKLTLAPKKIKLLLIILDKLFQQKKYSHISQISLQLILCGPHYIRQLNKTYRHKDKVTDVLSFPVHESLSPSDLLGPLRQQLLLGDIIICVDKIFSQAEEFAVPWSNEFFHLFIHGLLHLCGYDHERSLADEKIMFRLEDKWVKEILALWKPIS